VLEQGYIRSIDTVENVKIWGEPWLPKDGRMQVESPLLEGPYDFRVRDLI